MMRPLILITNDDGIFSPGLLAAAEAVADLGELLIVAPHTQQTSMSRSLPSGPAFGMIEEVALTIRSEPHAGYAVHGSPALAVVHALFELADRPPALCVSGINYGENVGMTTLVSGTVGAALEASMSGIPALAVSREAALHLHRADTYGALDWTSAAHFTRLFSQALLRRPLPPEIAVLNVNVPSDAAPETAIRATVQSRQAHAYFARAAGRDRTLPFRLDVISTLDPDTLEPDSDIHGLLFDRVVTVTPLTGNLTAKLDVARWFEDFGL